MKVPATIYLELIDSKYSDEFIELSARLAQYNFIDSENRIIRASLTKPNVIEIICQFVDKFTCDNWSKQDFIIDYFQEKFDNFLIKPPYTESFTDIISKVDELKVCNCENSPYYFLTGKEDDYTGGIYCGICKSLIPNYHFNNLDIDISSWFDNFFHIYQLDLYLYDSESIEMWCEAMLYDINSELNQKGITLSKELSILTQKPVYYAFLSKSGNYSFYCSICGKLISKISKHSCNKHGY